MRRDRLTFAMIVGVPILQLVSVRLRHQHRPEAAADRRQSSSTSGPIGRAIVSGMQLSDYFDVLEGIAQRKRTGAKSMLERGDVTFIVTIPAGFERAFVRGEQPQILVEADATDPTAASRRPRGAEPDIINRAVLDETQVQGPLSALSLGDDLPINLVVHKLYNPEGITAYNIVPGLLGHDPHHDHHS